MDNEMRLLLILFMLGFLHPSAGQAQEPNAGKYDLRYNICVDPKNTGACFIAYHKIRSLINPSTNKNYFEDNIHTSNGKLFLYPEFEIAEIDLDGDGFKEIIAKITEPAEEIMGLFCKPQGQCPHFIIQDRNILGQKPSLNNFKAMGPIYSFAVGLSSDEVFGGYRSLRAYKDGDYQIFDVYQYDRVSDDYFNISTVR